VRSHRWRYLGAEGNPEKNWWPAVAYFAVGVGLELRDPVAADGKCCSADEDSPGTITIGVAEVPGALIFLTVSVFLTACVTARTAFLSGVPAFASHEMMISSHLFIVNFHQQQHASDMLHHHHIGGVAPSANMGLREILGNSDRRRGLSASSRCFLPASS
jgi:hypothetical protein